MEDDWDLQAVVRGCSTTSTTTATTAAAATTTANINIINNTNNSIVQDFHPFSCFSSPEQSDKDTPNLFSISGPFNARNSVEELHELYQPFFSKSHPVSSQSQNAPISSLPSFEVSYHTQPKQQHQQQPPKLQSHATPLTPAITATHTTHSQTQRSKRRKNQLKKVSQVPAESLSSDVWSWRKYGQKPIKGSPYPRGYYRCSSSKGCLARKQVERNRSDPGMFIVTYTGEHNHPAPTHRNSLAGTTRQKPSTAQTLTASDSNKPSTSPATSMDEELVLQNIKTESREEIVEEEEEDEFGFSDMVLGDDFFTGLEGVASPVTGDCFSDQLNSFCDVGLCLL